MIQRIIAIGAIVCAMLILAWHFYFSPILDTRSIMGVCIVALGGFGYTILDSGKTMLNYLKNRKIKIPDLTTHEKDTLAYLNEARVHIDALMKIGLENNNDVIKDAMLKLNSEAFMIYHK